MTDVVGPGTLKLVSGWSPSRSVDHVLEEILTAHAGANDVRRLHHSSFVVYSELGPFGVRNWFVNEFSDDESLLVVEFETWSSLGPCIDRTWLLRRGH